MADSALVPILSWLGWAFVPGWATSTLQSIYYKLKVPVGQHPPRPGTQQFAKDYRRIRILVLTLYLIYTLLQSLYDIRLAGDFFTLLSVTPGSTDREVRSRFRRLAAIYHPDKIQSATINPEDITTSSDAQFLLLKTAQDTLLNPTLRFAYTRFGPSIVRVTLPASLKPSIRSYVYAGLRHNLLPNYFTNIVGLTALNYFFLPKWGTYWRYYILTVIFTIELYFLTHSNPSLTDVVPPFFSKTILPPIQATYAFIRTHTKLQQLLPPHLLPFQTLTVLRRLALSLNIFISQLAPPKAAQVTAETAKSQMVAILNNVNQSLTHLVSAAQRADQESTSLLSLQLSPFKGNDGQTEKLREGMKEGMLKGALMANPEVRSTIERVQARRRREEPG